MKIAFDYTISGGREWGVGGGLVVDIRDPGNEMPRLYSVRGGTTPCDVTRQSKQVEVLRPLGVP